LYQQVFGQQSSPNLLNYLERIRKALDSRTVIQVARTNLAQYVFPWAQVYDIPLPNRDLPGRLKWCKVLEEWGGPDANRAIPPAKRCPYQDTDAHQRDVLCPYGFWGLKHYVEQPINVQSNGGGIPGDNTMPQDALSKVVVTQPVSLSIAVTRDAALDAAAIKVHLARIEALNPYTPAGGADQRDNVYDMLKTADVAYFLCHGEFDNKQASPYLGVGPKDADPLHRVYPGALFGWATSTPGFWRNRHPLIFINGCHTADLKPGEILSFVTTFANFGASAVVGTEVSIRLPLATAVGEAILRRLIGGEPLGAAMHSERWDLANKGNLLGLAYTPYGLTDLTLQAAN
jgi:hypothetical protein